MRRGAGRRARRRERAEAPELAADTLLSVRNLQTWFFSREGTVKAVDGVSFDVTPGEILGIAGESGCGKSVTSQSILRIVPDNGRIVGGRILFRRGGEGGGGGGADAAGGTLDLAAEEADGTVIRSIRGKEIAMVFQEPMTSFSPVHTIGNQIIETVRIHQQVTEQQARAQALEMLRRVGMPTPTSPGGTASPSNAARSASPGWICRDGDSTGESPPNWGGCRRSST